MMGPQARVLRSAQRRIVAHLRATRTQAKVEPVQGLFNFRCHENCVQWVRQRPDEDLEVVETVLAHKPRTVAGKNYISPEARLKAHREALEAWQGRADAWFLDGFSPALNPAMWRQEVLDLDLQVRPPFLVADRLE